MVLGWLRRGKKITDKKQLCEIKLDSTSFEYLLVEAVKYKDLLDPRVDVVHANFESDGPGYWFSDKHRISMTREDFLKFQAAIAKIQV